MNLLEILQNQLHDRYTQNKKSKYIVMSEIMYSRLRIEILGIDYALNHTKHHLTSYQGLEIIKLDTTSEFYSLFLVG